MNKSDFPPLQVDFMSAASLQQHLHGGGHLLGLVRYGREGHNPHSTGCPVVPVEMAQHGDIPMLEVWTSPHPVSYGIQGNIRFARTEQVLFGFIRLEESAEVSLDQLSRKAYESILQFLEQQAYPHLVRLWNYFPGINLEDDGMERYRLFSIGRYQAMNEHEAGLPEHPPAASALGAQAGGLVIYFVSAKEPGRRVENPRQVSAFRYPAQYGPRAPSFSRAALKRWGGEQHLYISGTASIVGHESLHIGDLEAQLAETLRNLQAVMDQAEKEAHAAGRPGRIKLAMLKVYIRHDKHYAKVRELLERKFSRRMPILYLRGDICRSDLLLEIDGFCFTAA